MVGSKDLEGVSEKEICENLSSQGVTLVKRIKVHLNNELVRSKDLERVRKRFGKISPHKVLL